MKAEKTCGARTVFWPDDEACDAECFLPRGHQPANLHEDESLGEWNEDELSTSVPEDEDEKDFWRRVSGDD